MCPNPCSVVKAALWNYITAGELEFKDEVGFDTSVFFKRVYQQRADLPELSFLMEINIY